MKKLFLILPFFCFFLCVNVLNVNSLTTSPTLSQLESSKTYNVKVYKFSGKNGHIRVGPTDAIYDSSEELLYVRDEVFRVRENPYYGDDSKYGSFEYCAGPYYFNF